MEPSRHTMYAEKQALRERHTFHAGNVGWMERMGLPDDHPGLQHHRAKLAAVEKFYRPASDTAPEWYQPSGLHV